MVRGSAVYRLVRGSADPLSTRILASLGAEYNSFRPGDQCNIEAISRDEAEVRRQIRATLLHGVGHYFGLSEEELRGIRASAGPAVRPCGSSISAGRFRTVQRGNLRKNRKAEGWLAQTLLFGVCDFRSR
jgi:hypothetical protein